MTPTPREVPIREAPAWPHEKRNWTGPIKDNPPHCRYCERPWPCPSQQYLDGLVAALGEKVARMEAALRDAYVMLPPDRIALLRPWTQALMGDLTCIGNNPDHGSAEDKGDCDDCRTGEETHE